MLSVFVGEDRVEAEKALKRVLNANYEVFDGENLSITDLPSIFQGTSLFETEKRQILIKDLSENTAVWEKVADYADTEHEVVIWETKIDKRSAGYKNLKAKGVEIREFALKKPPEANLVFGVLDTAMSDGRRAVQMVEKIQDSQDPYMFFGLMVTQALKKFSVRQGSKERKLLKRLAELDLQMKTTTIEPWSLVKAFLLEVEGDSRQSTSPGQSPKTS